MPLVLGVGVLQLPLMNFSMGLCLFLLVFCLIAKKTGFVLSICSIGINLGYVWFQKNVKENAREIKYGENV